MIQNNNFILKVKNIWIYKKKFKLLSKQIYYQNKMKIKVQKDMYYQLKINNLTDNFHMKIE